MTKKKTTNKKKKNTPEDLIGSINICGYDYNIYATNDQNKLMLNNQACYGICDFINQEIYVSKAQHQQAREETLIHEILHAIDYYTSSSNPKLSEEDIERLAIGLAPIVRKGIY